MMMISFLDLQQDTVQHKTVPHQDSARISRATDSLIVLSHSRDTVKHKFVSQKQVILPDNSDTTSVCTRNSIADVTYYDFNNFILRLGYGSYKQFPYVLIDKGNQLKLEQHEYLMKHLKQGNERPSNPLHTDWMLIIIVISVFLFSVIRSTTRNILPYFDRVFIFRRKNESGSRDSGGLFHWQSTILNLIAFLIIALFGYSAMSYFDLIPHGFSGIVIWLITMGILSAAVTIRHAVCLITGAASEQQEVFREYLHGIYHSYRVGAIFLFVIIIMMTYTLILPVRDYIISGIIILGLIYLIRVIRLLIIFLNRNISIFYLILYLCALEILPVLIIVKYFTGLV
jgi:hypothetical protein